LSLELANRVRGLLFSLAVWQEITGSRFQDLLLKCRGLQLQFGGALSCVRSASVYESHELAVSFSHLGFKFPGLDVYPELSGNAYCDESGS